MLPYFDLNLEKLKVQELRRVEEANSDPIDIHDGIPIAGVYSYRAYVSMILIYT